MTMQTITPRQDAPALAPIALPRALPPGGGNARARLFLVGERDRAAPRVAAAGRTSISINGRWHAFRGKTATFDQILRVAFPDRPLANPEGATVTFRHGVPTWPAGSLTPGDIIELTDGLSINAIATSAS